MKLLSILVLALPLWLPAFTHAGESNFAVIGYLPEYRLEKLDAARIDGITDLVFFGIEPPADGRLPSPLLKPSILKKLQQTKRLAKCRFLISVGGWKRSKGFSDLAGKSESRKRFIQGIRAYCLQHGFDGIDYDWEHPKTQKELADYARLLSETSKVFQDTRLKVTVAQAPWQDLGKAAYDAVDRVHLMSYDHRHPQATFDKTKADIERLIGWRCPPGKIAIGLPFYGRNQKGQAKNYSALVGQGPIDPNEDSIDGFAFNGKTTVGAKVKFAMERKLSGVMIWELGQDSQRKDASLRVEINRLVKLSRRQTDK